MAVNPSPLDQPIALLCPICREPIEVLRPDVPMTEEQRVEATEAMILMHVQAQHTMHSVLAALGTARNALMDIADACEYQTAPDARVLGDALRPMIHRGLGGQ